MKNFYYFCNKLSFVTFQYVKNMIEIRFQNVIKGDISAFESIYKEYFSRLCVLSEKIVGDNTIAEDIVQNFFFKLWTERSKLSNVSNYVGYMTRSVHNLSLQHIRQNNIHTKHHGKIYDDKYASAEYFDKQEDMASDDNRIIILRRAIKSLPEQCRMIIVKSRYEGKKSAEIASEMGLSVRTVENQIYNGIKRIKSYI